MTRLHTPTRLALLACLSLFACHGSPARPPIVEAPARTETAPVAPLVVVPPTPETQATTLELVLELGRTDNRVQDHLHHLCVEIGPRLTSSTQLQAACEWTRDQFESYGLEARLERWGEYPVGFDRGPWSGRMVAPEVLELEFNTMAWTPGTDGAQRGPAVAFPTSEEELEALGDRLSGAWLVRPPGQALKNEADEVVFEKPEQPSNDLIEAVRERMLAKGALGEVRGARNNLLITDGNYRIDWNDLPERVEVRVRRDQHDLLWQRMQTESVELEFDIDNFLFEGPVPQYNVVADLVGWEKPDEFVIVSGHLDSWDGAQGAVDNGTGCATTLEVARLLTAAGARPARTIRFILWTGEEQGLFGSRDYVKAHADELPKISGVFVHDGGTNYLSGLGVTAAMMPALEEACAPLATLDPKFPFELVEVEGLPNFVGSDNDPFVGVGVPGFFWNQSGRSDYDHYHHTQHDHFDASIPEYQEHSTLVAAITAFNVANLPELLDRTNMRQPQPRRMGVQLDSTKVTEVIDGSLAEEAGIQAGDVILSIDGEPSKTQSSISRSIRAGGSQKVLSIQRGEATLELTLDWSSDPDEARRLIQMREREERDADREAEREARRAERRKE